MKRVELNPGWSDSRILPPMSGLRRRARRYLIQSGAHRCWACMGRGFPCWPGRKEPRIKGGNLSASNDEAKVRARWTKWPDANVAICTKPRGLTIVDCDHGNQSEADFRAWRAAAGLPETYTVRTGRRDGFGVQMYYSTPGEDPAKSMAWDEETHTGDIRGCWGYVMAAGCRGHVCVSLRCFQIRMSHHLLQAKDVSATAQIAGCERVPGCVERACWCVESQRQAEPLHIAQHVAAVERRLCRCCEQERFRLAAEVCNVAVDGLTQLEAEWDHALLAALAVQRDKQIVKVDVRDAQLEDFANPRPGVEQEQQDQMEPPLKSAFRLPLHQRADLFVSEGGQDVLRLFQLRDSRMLASGTAFHLRPGTGPMRVCVDGADGRIASRGTQPFCAHFEHGCFQVVLCGCVSVQPFEAVLVPFQR